MTILHVSTPATWRGGEQQVAYLATAFQQLNMDQVILCPEGAVLGARMMELNIPVASFKTRGSFDLMLARKISDLCKGKHFDIIHCHDSHAHSAAVVSAALFKNNTPIIVSRRVDFPVSSNPFSRWKYNHPSVKYIICVSDTIRTITAPAIKDLAKLSVVHSGIDLSKYSHASEERILISELGLHSNTKMVGNLSALADHKDYPTYLRTAAAVIKADPTIHFIIAGQGPEENRIKKMIRSLRLEANVHMLGFRSDIVEVMKSLDLFLITSRTEGLGTIVLEAFAAGVPVVATRAGGIPEMVEDTVTGLLAEPGDIESLKNATLRILQDPVLKNTFVQNALMRVQDFSYQATAEKTLAIYEKSK
jgi:glycosyltransferase involved in cell wall biosynthesis